MTYGTAFGRPPHPPSASGTLTGVPGVCLASKPGLAMNCRYRQSAKKFSAKEHRPSKVSPSDRASVPVERHASADFVLMISIAQGQAGGSARLFQAHLKSLAKPAVGLPMSMVGIEISTQLPRPASVSGGRRAWWAMQNKQKTTPCFFNIWLQTRCRDLHCSRRPASLEIWRL